MVKITQTSEKVNEKRKIFYENNKIILDFLRISLYTNKCKEEMSKTKTLRKGENKVADKTKEEALQELLRLIADNPDLADRITITIKPEKLKQRQPQGK